MPYIGKKPENIIATAVDSTTGTFSGDVTSAGTVNVTGDTAAGDDAAIGFTSAEGLILTGQGSTSDITVKNDADATVFTVPTGTDDILFPDNAKILMGAGSDLQIFHDGSNSNIDDAGTGPLRISSNGTGIDFNKGTSETMAKFKTDGAVELYHDGTKKIETTSSGVDISGTIEADDKVTIAYESGSSDWELESTSGDDFTISRNGSQKLLIDGSTSNTTLANGLTLTDGNLVVASGHGIDFSATANTSITNASMSSELLDDYEEGTWTPVVSGSSSGIYSLDSGFKARYTKIGAVCHVSATFGLDSLSGSASGYTAISGFPFNYNGGLSQAVSTVACNNVNLSSSCIQLVIAQASSGTSNSFFLTQIRDNTTSESLDLSSLSSSSDFTFSVTYQVA